ncbi:MAG: transcriptional repressor general negative regulator of transcription subunit 4 [Thelocarpon impressellum]|nr:MAG: transcriptional repressor general negative regulator of transcription subunit 4 [Thelocarpon impressellum]
MGSTGQDIASGSPRASAGQSTNTTRSNTPGAPGNRDQELPTLRSTQPKTLRVVATPKMETPPPMSATTSASAPSPVVRPPSRKTSLASINQPVTPASELISDNASMTSTSMSRANSPPPSKVGSAPLRQTTKSQQKKQRKEAKKEVEKKEQGDVVVNAPLEDIDIAPIVGRKKKQKGKALGAAIAGDMAAIGVGGPTSPLVKETNDVVGNTRVVKADTAINEKDAANEEEKKSVEEVAAKDTTPVAIKPILSAQSIIHDLIRNGEFEPDRHDLLKPVSGVSQRMDVSSADFVDLHRKLSLSTDDQIALGEGHPVRIPLTTPKADGSTHTSRLLVTPGGLTLRGLTPVQEARFLELEERINDCRGPTRFHPARHGGENGFSMVGGRVVQSGPGAMAAAASAIGGRDATAAAADCAANKMRVDEALAYINQFVLPALPSREVSGTGARGKNDSSTSAAASDPNRTRYVMPVSTEGFGADVAGVMHFMASGMDSNGAAEKPGSSSSVSARSGLPSVPLLSVEEAESAMLAAKRETEGLEKRLNALLKKNRRLVLQGSGH